jgi:hypothetical protein
MQIEEFVEKGTVSLLIETFSDGMNICISVVLSQVHKMYANDHCEVASPKNETRFEFELGMDLL